MSVSIDLDFLQYSLFGTHKKKPFNKLKRYSKNITILFLAVKTMNYLKDYIFKLRICSQIHEHTFPKSMHHQYSQNSRNWNST